MPTVDKVSLKNLEVKSAIAKIIKKWKNAKKSCEKHGETCR